MTNIMNAGETLKLIFALAGVAIPGIAAWVGVVIRMARLEERVKMHEKKHDTTGEKLDDILEELKQLREYIHTKKQQ